MDEQSLIVNKIYAVNHFTPLTKKWSITKRKFSYIAYQLSGVFLHNNKYSSFIPVSDSIMFINKDEEFDVECLKWGESIAIHMDFSAPVNVGSFSLKLEENNQLRNLFIKIEREWRYGENGGFLKILSMLYQILPALFNEQLKANGQSEYPERLKAAIKLIKQNYQDKNFSVYMLSRLCGVSEQYLRTLFKKSGLPPPRRYIVNVRIKAAGELLNNAGYTVTDVAELAGFSNLSYFSQSFKTETGMTPQEFIRLG